jgi:hypothetical protein
MIRKQTLYCLGCGQLISREKANKTFRTGFYRVIYPLAFCIDCAKREELKEHETHDPSKLPFLESLTADLQVTML